MEILSSYSKDKFILELNSDEFKVLQLLFLNSDDLKDVLKNSLLNK